MAEATSAWQDTSLAPGERAKKLVEAMTLEQKIAQLHGAMETIDIYAIAVRAAESGADMDQLAAQIRVERHVRAIDELGIPRFRITNGPVGVGMGDGTPSPPATSLPMTIGLAAGFDPDLAHSYGDIIGSETATLGQHVLEGPGVCLHRTTIAGRNFEYFSEDPYLSGVMGVAVAKAIQAHDVIAMAKHYVVNDQEYERFRASVEVDEHVLRELYLLPFEMLVKDAEIAAVMSAYNRVRSVYATEYRYTLTDILRAEWGFEGYVQSDFWSCRSAAPSLNAGMDHEMPDAKWLNETNVKAALQDTSLEIATVDRALVRRYTQMFRFGQFERPYDPGEIDAQAHGAVSRTIGAQIAVLLKNEGGLLGKKRAFIVFGLVGVVAGVGISLSPPSIPWIPIVFFAVMGISTAGVNTLMWALEADTVEYGEWRTGVRTEGITYALFSFTRKFGQAVGGAMAAFVIGLGGYVGGVATQSQSAINAIRFASGFAPAIFILIGIAIFFRYPLTEQVFTKMVAETAARRAARRAAPQQA